MRAARLRVRMVLAISAAAFSIHASPASAECAGADAQPVAGGSPALQVALVQATACLIGDVRAAHGLPPVKLETRLTLAAHRHATDLREHNTLSHASTDGSDVVTRAGEQGYTTSAEEWELGEILGWGTGALATPRAVVGAWLASPGHRSELLRAGYNEMGVMVLRDALRDDAAIYVVDFGTRKTAAPKKARKTRKARRARSSRS